MNIQNMYVDMCNEGRADAVRQNMVQWIPFIARFIVANIL